MKPELTVSGTYNAGFGDFVAVSAEVNGRLFGCDCYLGTGDCREEPNSVPVREIADWQDGNGLLANDVASEAEVWEVTRL